MTLPALPEEWRLPDDVYASVPLDRIHPNPWNPNRMTDEMQRMLRTNIERNGFNVPVLVRPHPSIDGAFEIVDGEHRWRVARTTGMKQVPVCIRHYTDAEAKTQTLAMNRIHGEQNAVDVAALIADIEQSGISVEEQATFTGYSEEEIAGIQEAAQFDWSPAPPDSKPKQDRPRDTDEWVTLSFRAPAPVADIVRSELDRIKQALDTDHDHLALEVMAVNSGHDDLGDLR